MAVAPVKSINIGKKAQMKNKYTAIILFSISGLTACSQLTTSAKETFDLAQNSVKQDIYNDTSAIPWTAGQWSLYKTGSITRDRIFYLFDSSQNKGFTRILLAAKSNNSFWLELAIVENNKEQHIAGLVSQVVPSAKERYKITALKFADGSTVKHLTETELSDGKGAESLERIDFWLNLILHSSHPGYHRNVTLPAGSFLNAKEVPISLPLQSRQMNGYVWYHNAIPIAPLVKFEINTTATKRINTIKTAELVDFGLAGQTSYFSFE